MTVTYREDGAWGSGNGANLTSAQVDENFYTLLQQIEAIEAEADAAPITDITVVGATMTITLADYRTFDLPLPVLVPHWRGTWLPNVFYAKGDLVYPLKHYTHVTEPESPFNFGVLWQDADVGYGLFLVTQDHVGGDVFDQFLMVDSEPAYFRVAPPGIGYTGDGQINSIRVGDYSTLTQTFAPTVITDGEVLYSQVQLFDQVIEEDMPFCTFRTTTDPTDFDAVVTFWIDGVQKGSVTFPVGGGDPVVDWPYPYGLRVETGRTFEIIGPSPVPADFTKPEININGTIIPDRFGVFP